VKEKGMDTTPEAGTKWTGKQAYALAVVCMLVGIPVGYLLRAPSTGSVSAPPQSVQQVAPANAVTAYPGQVTPDRLTHMADKQAEPLLAELKEHPNDPSLLAKLGNTYLAAHQFQSAQNYYERSLAVKAGDPAVLTQLASSYYYQGDTDKAIATLQRALKIDPGYANALYNLGMMQWQVKSDPKGAIALWEKLLKTNPDHPQRAQVEQMIARAKQHLSVPPGTKTDKPAL